MNDSTKTLIGTVAALAALVACVSIMAECTARTDTEQVAAADCVKAGGRWHASADPMLGGDCIGAR